MALAEALREIRGWQRTTLQIACRPSGQGGYTSTAAPGPMFVT